MEPETDTVGITVFILIIQGGKINYNILLESASSACRACPSYCKTKNFSLPLYLVNFAKEF